MLMILFPGRSHGDTFMALWLPNYQAPIVCVCASIRRNTSCKTPQLREIRLVENPFFFQQLVMGRTDI